MTKLQALELLLRYAVALLLMVYLLNQVRKPTKWVGRLFLCLMNKSHSKLTDWALSHVQVGKQFTILDVGCGGGRTIQKLAAIAGEGVVCGVDYSAGSVAAATATNAEAIKAGRVQMQQASVSRLPFPDSKFDLVTAIETQYYWPNLLDDMREILRVLKPGGALLVVVESYKHQGENPLEAVVMKLLRSSRLSAAEQRELFLSAGYTDVQIFEEPSRGWLCAMGRKPEA